MKAKPLLRWTFVGCWGLMIVTFTTGCARWVELMPTASSSREFSVREIARDEQVPLVMDSVRMTRNSSPQNPSLETEHRVLGTLRKIGLFSHLSDTASAEPPASEKFIRARLLFDEAVDPHPGDVAWKGIVTAVSMFVLTPFIQLEYDYATRVTLELERWDGQVKRYESHSAGTAHYQLFGATTLMIDELKGHVTETCLTALMQQMVNDTTFYTASSTPLSDRPIRSVSVKSQRSEPVPVSLTLTSGK